MSEGQKARFAPGPWQYYPEFDGIHWTDSKSIVECGDNGEVAVLTRGWAEGVAEANAHLIAAAPAMYEALKALMSDNLQSFPVDADDKARSALAQAEGRNA